MKSRWEPCLEGPVDCTVIGIALGGSIKKETHAHSWHLKYIPTTWKCCRSYHPHTFLGIAQPISVSPDIQTGMLAFLKLWKWTGINIPGQGQGSWVFGAGVRAGTVVGNIAIIWTLETNFQMLIMFNHLNSMFTVSFLTTTGFPDGGKEILGQQ